MKDYLLNVMEQRECGLYLCELPTGNGKTFDSAQAMRIYADKEYIKELADRITEEDRLFRYEITKRLKKCFPVKYLVPLIQGELQMTKPDKPNSRNQKYIAVKY